MMQTIDTNLLDHVLGGAGASTNPAHLKSQAGAPLDTAKNDSLAKAWNKAHGVTKDAGGNYTKVDGPFPNLYRYEYFNGSPAAPGAGD